LEQCRRRGYNVKDSIIYLAEFPRMNTFTADASLEAALIKLDAFTEIRDSRGNLIGFFAPPDRADELLYLEAAAHFDPEEMNRRIAAGRKGATTKEVLERLQQLDKPKCDTR
jgi:hypothetical protein